MATKPPTGATFSGKMNKDDVRYRISETCRSCDYYVSGTCQIVEGNIAPNYICDKWVVNAHPKDKGLFADYYINEYKKVNKNA